MNSTKQLDSNSDGGDSTCDCGDSGSTKTMSNDNDLGVSSLTVDAVRDRNANVDERIEDLEGKVRDLQGTSQTIDSVREALDVDGDVSVLEAVKTLQDHASDLDSELSEYKDAELTDLRESICDASNYEMEDLEEKGKDELSLISDALDHSSVSQDDADGSGDDEFTLKTPTNDASDKVSGSDMKNFDPRELYDN